tara:strand:+ start:581 stop:1036 length:456 start_codon:yes stop_codon:yes gene_type:complete
MPFKSGPASPRSVLKSKEITTATYQIARRDHGSTLMLNRAAGIVLTLPVDTIFVGFTVKMVVRDTFSGTWEVTGQADGDLFFGGIFLSSVAAKSDRFGPNGSSNDTLKADADAKGRLSGGFVNFTCMGPNEWLVDGVLAAGGTPVTPFADT